MSNATHDSRNPGDPKRRRRSRGGQNRRNQGGNAEGRSQDGRGNERGSQHRGQPQDRRGGEPRAQGRKDDRPARKYSAPKLTWWQKILSALGLYKVPAKPARPERKEAESKKPQNEARPVKSNTRNARSGDNDGTEVRPERNRNREGGRGRNQERRRGGDPASVESSRVYVGNLSYEVTESDLQDLFKGIGGVRNVEIVYNRATHRSKGYGFVEMLNFDEAKRAVEVLHDQPFMGRKLNVSGAKKKGQDEREEKDDEAQPNRRSQPVLAPTRPAVAQPSAEAPQDTAVAPESVPAVDSVPSPSDELEPPLAETPAEASPVAAMEIPAEKPAEVSPEAAVEVPSEAPPELISQTPVEVSSEPVADVAPESSSQAVAEVPLEASPQPVAEVQEPVENPAEVVAENPPEIAAEAGVSPTSEVPANNSNPT
jgi:hypothetical protein